MPEVAIHPTMRRIYEPAIDRAALAFAVRDSGATTLRAEGLAIASLKGLPEKTIAREAAYVRREVTARVPMWEAWLAAIADTFPVKASPAVAKVTAWPIVQFAGASVAGCHGYAPASALRKLRALAKAAGASQADVAAVEAAFAKAIDMIPTPDMRGGLLRAAR